MKVIVVGDNNLDEWELLKKYWRKFLTLNGIVLTEHTTISSLHTIIGVICMVRNCFLGTDKDNQDLRNQFLKADNSRTGKGLIAM